MVNQNVVETIDPFASLISYVMQDDCLVGWITPREALRFSADFQLVNTSDEIKNLRVEQIVSVLGLERCENTLIGDVFTKGISGGERKRTSMGIELITNPSVIYLDEPTTGLDAVTAYKIVNVLAEMANAGRTVICTIHQPNSKIFENFDSLMLLLEGNIIY